MITIDNVVPPTTPNAPLTAESIHFAPNEPYITEGTAASIAIAKYSGALAHLGESLEINSAVIIDIGVAINNASIAVHKVLSNMNPAAKYVTPS